MRATKTLTAGLMIALTLGTFPAIGLAQTPPKPAAAVDFQKALEAMDSRMTEECLKAAAQLERRRREYQDIKKTLDQAPTEAAKKAARDQLARWADEVRASLAKLSPELRELLRLKEKVEALEQRVKAAPAQYLDLARAYHDEVFVRLAELKDPAGTAQRLLADLAAKKVFEKPFEFPEAGLAVQIKNFNPKDYKASLFSKKSNLELEITYAGNVKVQATGLYFTRPGPTLQDRQRCNTT